MRNYSMPEREALKRIQPKDRASKKQLLGIIGFVIIGIAGAGGLVYARYRTQQYREQNWDSAIATVEDVRPKLVGQINGQYGGAMLYDVEVLARFSVGNYTQERWITVEQTPRSLDSVHFQERMWRGKSYFVRWKPPDPQRIEIEVH
jgi:hypothetical protein